MKRIPKARTALATVAGLSLVGVLAGCASTTSVQPASTTYKDGTYSADGAYVSPGGQEEIAVTLTVKNNLIAAVTVTSAKADDEAAQYQSQFASGISSVAVGKNLASLSVSTVAGSSLTSRGFNAALAIIRNEAKA